MDRLVVGEVLKPQGIRGELKVKSFTDAPEDVKAFGTVYIDNVPYKILSFRLCSGCRRPWISLPEVGFGILYDMGRGMAREKELDHLVVVFFFWSWSNCLKYPPFPEDISKAYRSFASGGQGLRGPAPRKRHSPLNPFSTSTLLDFTGGST